MGIWPSPGTADGRPHRPVRPMAPRGSSAAALGTSRSTTVSTASHGPATWAALVGERSSEVQWSLRESEHARVRAPQKHTLLRTLRQSLQTGISSCHRRRKRVTSAAAWLPLVCFQVVGVGGECYGTLRTVTGPHILVSTYELLPGSEHGARCIQLYLPTPHLRLGCHTASTLSKTISLTAQLPGKPSTIANCYEQQGWADSCCLLGTIAQEMAVPRSGILR